MTSKQIIDYLEENGDLALVGKNGRWAIVESDDIPTHGVHFAESIEGAVADWLELNE